MLGVCVCGGGLLDFSAKNLEGHGPESQLVPVGLRFSTEMGAPGQNRRELSSAFRIQGCCLQTLLTTSPYSGGGHKGGVHILCCFVGTGREVGWRMRMSGAHTKLAGLNNLVPHQGSPSHRDVSPARCTNIPYIPTTRWEADNEKHPSSHLLQDVAN